MADHAFIVLTAGQISSELTPIFGDIPSALIPLRGKPALMHNLKAVLQKTTADLYLVVGHRHELIQQRVLRYLTPRVRERVKVVMSDPAKRPGWSFLTGIEEARAHGVKRVSVILGDTLLNDEILGHIAAGESFIGVSHAYTNPARWALVQREQPLEILDKPADLEGTVYPAIIGVYHLESLEGGRHAVSNVEISKILMEYSTRHPLRAIEIQDWTDLGHIDNYYATRRRFIVTRHFNAIEVDSFSNILTKSSKNREKLIAEIDWCEALPPELKWVFPAVYEVDRASPAVKMEFVPYPSLDELYLYSGLHPSTWKAVIGKLTRLLALFNRYRADVSIDDYRDIYVTKVRTRLAELAAQNEAARALIEAKSITVNGVACGSIADLVAGVERLLPKLHRPEDNAIVHGDFCFANILYSPESGALKLIDPRGAWGKPGIHGDGKYDLAKLMHSISGGYDSIIADYFDVDAHGDQVQVAVFKPEISATLEEALFASTPHRREEIELLEGTILMSIASIHREDPRRQVAMLAVGAEKVARNLARV